MDERSLKRKLRQLKEVELIVRFGTTDIGEEEHRTDLIWNHFFKGKGGRKAKYPFDILLIMNNEGRKRVFADYLYTVYTEVYKQKGMLLPTDFDYRALFDFDLPANATKEDIKKRFRELAKIAHPDHGGSNEAMVALLEQYKKLIGN
ncbi:MAG TPA: J domain-containing protein [Clostridiales bacterium]|nr:J domain-containing protein [Clostridiales bacterium]